MGADLATSVYGLNGTGVGIALLDSGINNNQDLNGKNGSRIVYSTSLVPNSDPNDHYGHGTHVSGILAGDGQQSTGAKSTYEIRGIAPQANLVSIKVLGDTGTGTDSTVIAGIQLAVQLKSKYNIRVMNLSVGRPITTSYQLDPLCQAVQQAWQAGIVVVVAAGNDGRDNSFGNNGYGTITAPGNSPYAITVGAMNTMGTATPADDKITSYTSKGPTLIDHIVKPDLVAPGNRVFSLNVGGSYFDKTYPTNDVAQEDYTSGNGVDWESILRAERHQHGDSHGERRGGTDDPAESGPNARPGKGSADEDGNEIRPRIQHGHRSDQRNYLHR